MILNYKKYGDNGVPLIILHGLFGMLDNWHSHAMAFSSNYQVYTLDLRNHGKSPHSDAFSYPLLAGDLNDFMVQQSISKAHLLGHSMGGKVVMEFAFDHPDKIQKLIVADISPKAYPPHHDEILDALEFLELDSIERRSEAENLLINRGLDMGTVQFLLKNLSKESYGYSWKFNLKSLKDNYNLIIGNIDDNKTYVGKTLFIKGGTSRYIKDEDLSMIKVKFPNSDFKTIKGVGHWVHAEAPEEFRNIVLDFLNDL